MSSGLNVSYESGSVSQIRLSSAKVRQPVNVYEWFRWFAGYAAVYTQKFKNKAPAIITYMVRIFNSQKVSPVVYMEKKL